MIPQQMKLATKKIKHLNVYLQMMDFIGINYPNGCARPLC